MSLEGYRAARLARDATREALGYVSEVEDIVQDLVSLVEGLKCVPLQLRDLQEAEARAKALRGSFQRLDDAAFKALARQDEALLAESEPTAAVKAIQPQVVNHGP